LIERESLDFVIANVENSAAGFGVTGDLADALLSDGVDAMTSGTHVWDKKEILDYIPRQPKLIRPANFPPGTPGRGSYVGKTRTGEPIGVINVMGRIFMQPLYDSFGGAQQRVWQSFSAPLWTARSAGCRRRSRRSAPWRPSSSSTPTPRRRRRKS